MEYQTINLGRLLCLRVHASILPEAILSLKTLALYTYTTHKQTYKYYTIIITHKETQQKYGFHVFTGLATPVDASVFTGDVIVCKYPQIIVLINKILDSNIWLTTDINFDQLSCDQWVDFRIYTGVAKTNLTYQLTFDSAKLPVVSNHELQCKILTPLTATSLAPGTIIVYYLRILGYEEHYRRVVNVAKKTFSTS